MVGVWMEVLDAGRIDVFCVQSLFEWSLLVAGALSILLECVERSCALS